MKHSEKRETPALEAKMHSGKFLKKAASLKSKGGRGLAR